MRRNDIGDDQRWKAAVKTFKPKKKAGDKNIEKDALAKKGRVHVQQADLATLQLRNRVLLKKRKLAEKVEKTGENANG